MSRVPISKSCLLSSGQSIVLRSSLTATLVEAKVLVLLRWVLMKKPRQPSMVCTNKNTMAVH